MALIEPFKIGTSGNSKIKNQISKTSLTETAPRVKSAFSLQVSAKALSRLRRKTER
jgi:hypothetical protein